MRLTKIKLAGFKSFVDPTSVHLPSNLTGIVGPNGCGKSNVIDAVRWVMGETSAKHLRGDTMADVIFNGSSSRKPVATASIELLFDNSDGTVTGEYAGYNEISVKRQVTRDGQSHYFLNGTRCRRRDITSIFLGTGLGPRSYSIIEQGTISRVIEAKPEELRVFLEEAAGISKYKERRRETENRMRHTRENLERLEDLRDEVQKQVEKLKRQARAAERYRELKEEERRFASDLLALNWREQSSERERKDREIAEGENRYQEAVAEQRAIEARLESLREQLNDANEAFNEVQGRYYSVGADIARMDQSIEHARDTRAQQDRDLDDVRESWDELQAHLSNDRKHLAGLQETLDQDTPVLQAARDAEENSRRVMQDAEQRMQGWQAEWDEFNDRSAALGQDVEVRRTRVVHLDQHLQQLSERIERARENSDRLVDPELDQEIVSLTTELEDNTGREAEVQSALASTVERISGLRTRQREAASELDSARHQLQSLKGRQSSLEALQQAALGKEESGLAQWLQARGLGDARRLAECLQVEPDWTTAVETVLGTFLQAVCVEDLESSIEGIDGADVGDLALVAANAADTGTPEDLIAEPLLAHVQCELPVQSLFAGVYVAPDLDAALALRPRLRGGESVVTQQGVMVGLNWIRRVEADAARSGVLAREQELRTLAADLETASARVARGETVDTEIRDGLEAAETGRSEEQRDLDDIHRVISETRAALAGKEARRVQMQARREELRKESEELTQRLRSEQTELVELRAGLEQGIERMESMTRDRDELGARRDRIRADLETAREQARTDAGRVHELALRIESARSASQSTEQALQRMSEQQTRLDSRRRELEQLLERGSEPMQALEAERAGYLDRRVLVEKELGQARDAVEGLGTQSREGEQQRHGAEDKVSQMRTRLEQVRLARQEVLVRLGSLEEQITESGSEPQALADALPDDADRANCASELEAIARRIQRLGAINLAAIDEFKEETERLEYLETQHADLSESLDTLDKAIRKIDCETRSRFRQTFEKVDAGMKEKFPRLFGGGHAYLELTGDDLLDAGVTVMARPPGKRNQSIHLLSGGEKALTAVALVFSIFELNPAPFCMLDEVDAPLDDANVGRFCEMVREMSDQVQFIIITHNKVTMEIAQQLSGVTMHEPGVSRLVSVDIDEAAQLAVG